MWNNGYEHLLTHSLVGPELSRVQFTMNMWLYCHQHGLVNIKILQKIDLQLPPCADTLTSL